jgi:uncharacterized protein YqgC (DUF456 family)
MLEIVAIVTGAILIFLGLFGSFLPVLPGPPLSFFGLLLPALVHRFSPPLTSTLMIVLALLTVAVTILDYAIPVLGARRYGTSKWGVWGSVAGMIVGIFFSPFGMLLGAFVGAVVAEWLYRRQSTQALKAGWGVVVGSAVGTVLKLGVSGLMTYYFVLSLW